MTRPDTSAEAVRDLENRLLGPMPCAADGGSDKALAMGAVVQGPSDVMLAMAMLRAMLQERDEAANAARVCRAMIQARGTNRDYQQARAEEAEAQLATARESALREAAAACRRAVPKAHTYASENADLYRAGDTARDQCISAIEALIGGPT